MTLTCVVFHLIILKTFKQPSDCYSQSLDSSINVVTCFIKATVIDITSNVNIRKRSVGKC